MGGSAAMPRVIDVIQMHFGSMAYSQQCVI